MEFRENHMYHLYNRGNRRQPIFLKEANYIFFLKKVRKFISPHCEIMNYCLMPNHFHFLIYADYRTVQTRKIGLYERNVLSEGIKNLLSSYAQAINKQQNATGSLFQQNTKAKCVFDGTNNYAVTCMHYIHQNPLKAGLVKKMEDWLYSSFRDYAGHRNGTLSNKALFFEMLDQNPLTFYDDSYKVIRNDDIEKVIDE